MLGAGGCDISYLCESGMVRSELLAWGLSSCSTSTPILMKAVRLAVLVALKSEVLAHRSREAAGLRLRHRGRSDRDRSMPS